MRWRFTQGEESFGGVTSRSGLPVRPPVAGATSGPRSRVYGSVLQGQSTSSCPWKCHPCLWNNQIPTHRCARHHLSPMYQDRTRSLAASDPTDTSNIAIFKLTCSHRVTGSDTRMCENRKHGVAISTAFTRAGVPLRLGWQATRCRTKAWRSASRSAPTEGAARGEPSVPRLVQGPPRHFLVANRKTRGRTRAELARGV